MMRIIIRIFVGGTLLLIAGVLLILSPLAPDNYTRIIVLGINLVVIACAVAVLYFTRPRR